MVQEKNVFIFFMCLEGEFQRKYMLVFKGKSQLVVQGVQGGEVLVPGVPRGVESWHCVMWA